MNVQKIAQLTGHQSSIYVLTAGKSQHHLLSIGGDGWLVEWDLRHPDLGKLIAQVDKQAFSALLLPQHSHAVIGDMDGRTYLIDLEKSAEIRQELLHRKGVFDLQIIGDQWLTAGGAGRLTRWSASGQPIESYQLSQQSLRSLAFCAERNEIAVGSSDGHIYLLDATHFTIKRVLERAHRQSVFKVVYAPNGDYLLSGGRDAHLNIWLTDQDYQLHSSRPAHLFTINDICYAPHGRYFATASRDKTLKIWDARSFELLKVIETVRDNGHINSVNALYWSAYCDYLLSAGDDRSIIVWQIGER